MLTNTICCDIIALSKGDKDMTDSYYNDVCKNNITF